MEGQEVLKVKSGVGGRRGWEKNAEDMVNKVIILIQSSQLYCSRNLHFTTVAGLIFETEILRRCIICGGYESFILCAKHTDFYETQSILLNGGWGDWLLQIYVTWQRLPQPRNLEGQWPMKNRTAFAGNTGYMEENQTQNVEHNPFNRRCFFWDITSWKAQRIY